MTSFKDIQMGRKLNWKHESDLQKAREAQVRTIHKMVCKVLKELRKAVDTDFWPLSIIKCTLWEEQGSLEWKMGGGLGCHEIVISPKFDSLNKLYLLHVDFGDSRDALPCEEDLRNTIAFLLKKL